MIRRESTHHPSEWILIPQVNHAAVAHRVAVEWARSAGVVGPPRDTVLAAIERHDDGWLAWDRQPAIDAQTGVPLDFTERSRADSDAIWSNSIDSVADLGPLAQWIVAEHFLSMRRSRTLSQQPGGRWFLDRFEPAAQDWRGQWQQRSGADDQQLDRLARQLPFFDQFSLKLCCTPRPDSWSLPTWEEPSTVNYRITPRSDTHFTVHPWPFRQKSWQVAAAAHRVPRRAYRDVDDVRVALTESHEICWSLSAD